MKKTIIVLIALTICSFPISSYSQSNKAQQKILTNILLEYNKSAGKEILFQKKPERFFSIGYNRLNTKFFLHQEEENVGPTVGNEELISPLSSYIGRQKTHQPLLYKNYTVSSGNNSSKTFKSSKLDFEFFSILSETKLGGLFSIGAALLTGFFTHEFGHVITADYVGAEGTKFDFLKKQNGTFFLGTTTVEKIDEDARLPLSMGGVMAADLTFEHALQSYRKNPTLYNKSLLFVSGLDFLRYCLYAFYMSDGHPYFDPIVVSQQTGLSKDVIFSVAFAKTMLNAYRVYSGNDRVVPYFSVDRNSAFLHIGITY